MTGWLTFSRVFGAVLALLVVSLAAVFTARGEFAWTVGFLFLAYDSWLLSRMILLARAALRGDSTSRPPQSSAASHPTMTVLVPARNECAVLPACLDALLAQEGQPERLVVIDDGSQDGTAAMLAERYPGVTVWSKPTSGKARSFNEILPQCESDLIVTIDADTVLEPGSLAAIRRAFAEDRALAAGCGVLEPRCRGGRLAGYFEFFQRYEYLRAFLWRLAWSRENALVLVSGAFAVYRRDVLEKLGGFDAQSWVEDYEILFRLHRQSGLEQLGWRVAVIPGARAVTDAPGFAGQFLRQRARWFGGFLATLFGNRDMVGDARFAGVGRQLLPVKTVDMLLPLFAAAAQISLIFLLVQGHFFSGILLVILAVKFVFDLGLHAWALRLHARWLGRPLGARMVFWSLAASVLEPVLFQPLRYTGAISGWVAFLRRKLTWESQRLVVVSEPAREGN